MLGVCVAGWLTYGSVTTIDARWLEPLMVVLRSQPWLFIAIPGVALVQVMNFRRRAMI
jgi:hypothetical protein